MRGLERIPYHPIILGVYPGVLLLAVNVDETKLSSGFRAVALSVIIAIVIWGIAWFFIRDRRRSAIATSILIVSFFYYGHLYLFIKGVSIFGVIIGRHRVVLPLWVGLTTFGLWILNKKQSKSVELTQSINILAIVLLGLSLGQIAFSQYQMLRASAETFTGNTDLDSIDGEVLPDIYYIIMDAYPRDDVLLEYLDFDNSPFLDALTDLGFYVAGCSRSNYMITKYSLTSSLNMLYLKDLNLTSEGDNKVFAKLRKSEVRKFLENYGYATLAFETGHYQLEIFDADFFFKRETEPLDNFSTLRNSSDLNNFEILFLRTTIISALLDLEPLIAENFVEIVNLTPRISQYETASYTLQKLPSLISYENPKFVFAHILSPHNPTVFDANGDFIFSEHNEATSYIDQLNYLNSTLISIIEDIINNSETPPLIILQGDHGSRMFGEEPLTLNILNAYFLPYGGDEGLYPTISPVNSFRVIFNHYFGTDYELLEDVAFLSSPEDRLDFSIIPETRPGCNNP